MTIQEAIRHLAATTEEVYCKTCLVDSVDQQARTVDVTPLDESAPILGVNLQANQEATTGLVVFPKKGSHVMVAFLSTFSSVVVATEEVERVVMVVGENDPVEIELQQSSLAITIGETAIEVDAHKRITLNKGHETMANATELQRQLNTMSGRIDSIIEAIQSAPVTPLDGGAALKASLVATLTPRLIEKETFANIKDENIKH